MRYTFCALAPIFLSLIVPAMAAKAPATKRPLPKVPPTAEAPTVELQGNETDRQIQSAYAKAIAGLLPALEASKPEAFRNFELLMQRSGRPGAEKERAACCQALAAVLQSDAAADSKVWILKQLIVLGRAEVVPVEELMLGEAAPVVRETARRALQHNPAGEASAALRSALTRAKEPAWQAALALALGARRDSASVPAIAALLKNKDQRTVAAALTALGGIGDSQAARVLADAQAAVPVTLRLAAAEAHLKCAERMLAAGEKNAASAIYQQYNQPAAPRAVRLAALAGVLRSSPGEAGRMTLRILGGSDADARAVAVGLIPELTPESVKVLAAGLDKLPADRRGAVLAALSARGEKAALPAAMAAARSAEPQSRLIGLAAVGQLGDASAVALLVEAMRTPGDAATAARESLLRLAGAEVNPRILAAMQAEKDPDRRTALVEVLESRDAPELVATLLPDLQSPDAKARRQAARVLGKLARPVHLPAMLPALAKAAKSDREEIEKALAAVCGRIAPPDQQAAPILEAYRTASPAERLALLPLLGRIGGPQALEALRAALNSPAEARDAAIRGLCNWPDASVAQELLGLAQRAELPAQQSLALRALIRVTTLKGGPSDKEKLQLLAQAMELAQRDPERNMILERANNLRNVQTLRFVAPYLDKPAQCTSASRTVVDLAHHGGLKGREKAEHVAALNKVIQLCKDQGVVERAQRELRDSEQ